MDLMLFWASDMNAEIFVSDFWCDAISILPDIDEKNCIRWNHGSENGWYNSEPEP